MLKSVRNLDYVVLLCDDMEPMKHFYHETLGFPIYRDWGEWVEMQIGATLLTLRKRGRSYDGPGIKGSAAVQLAFRVTPAQVDSCYIDLKQRDVHILEEPISHDYGHRTLFFTDPEGNILEIYADI